LHPAPAGGLLAFLAQIPDPRGRQGRRHPWWAMLATIVCAVLQGARGYSAIHQWIHCREAPFWHLLGYLRRPPSANTFRSLLMRISPEELEGAVRQWVEHCLAAPTEDVLEAVAIDGKTLCGSLERHARAVHLLSALDQRTGCTLSQTRVDASTNEAKAALELLHTLVLKGRVVTGDAMFCQREICEQILQQGGDYLFVVKDNQPALKEAIAAEFRPAFSPGERSGTHRVDRLCGGNHQGPRPPGAAPSASHDAIGRPQRLARPAASQPVGADHEAER
jgi:hypothetical protein